MTDAGIDTEYDGMVTIWPPCVPELTDADGPGKAAGVSHHARHLASSRAVIADAPRHPDATILIACAVVAALSDDPEEIAGAGALKSIVSTGEPCRDMSANAQDASGLS